MDYIANNELFAMSFMQPIAKQWDDTYIAI
jgi:hypothetical protein